jgi:hypothetical protein
MNWLAIICAGAAYWVLGFVWYSLLFGKIWGNELRNYRADWPTPVKGEIAGNLIGTFISNCVAATAIAYLLQNSVALDLNHALRLGIAAGVGLSATALTIANIWESKPTKVWMIDTSYHLLGCILATVILFSWH